MKTCTKCKIEQSLDSFNKDVSKPDGVYLWCRTCVSKRNKSYYSANKEAHHLRTAKWRMENPDGQSVINRRSHKANKEKRNEYSRKYRAENLEHMRHLGREWSKNNLDKARIYNANRRAAKLQATPIWASDEFESFAIDEMYELAYARKESTGFDWHVDHIVPMRSSRVCGLHCVANLQVIPAVENHAKGNRFWPLMA